jgi:hypothetical protein
MPRVGFEPTISAGEQPQTYALEKLLIYNFQFFYLSRYGVYFQSQSYLEYCEIA